MAGHVGARAAPQQWPDPASIAQTSSACSVVLCADYMQTSDITHTAADTVAVGSMHNYKDGMHLTSGEAGMHTKYSRNAPQNSGQRLAAPRLCRISPLPKAPLLLLLLSDRCICPRSVLTCTHHQLCSSNTLRACHDALHLPDVYSWRHEGRTFQG